MSRVRQQLLPALALLALTLCVYYPAISGPLIWDDWVLIRDNAQLRSLQGLQDIWTSTDQPDYFPLTSTTFWIEWQLYGERPAGYHLVNILLHAASGIVLWRLLQQLGVPAAWCIAAVFIVHPVNVMSVAWISERKNTLSMLWLLLAALLFVRFDRERQSRLFGASLLCFVLALLSKTSVVVLPVLMVMYLFWQYRRPSLRSLLATAPFFLLSLVFGLVTIAFQHRSFIEGQIGHEDFITRLARAGLALWFYLYKIVCPVHLAALYPKWVIDGSSPMLHLAWLAWLLVFAVLLAVRHTLSRAAAFALAAMTVALLPVLGFIDMSLHVFTFVADHLCYIATVPVIAIVIAAGAWTMRGMSVSIKTSLAVVLIVILATLSWQRAALFRDSERFWAASVANYGDSFGARFSYALALQQKYHVDQAIEQYEQSLRLNPNYLKAYNNLGMALFQQGKVDQALQQYRQAQRLAPDNAIVLGNLANALALRGETSEALDHFSRAVRSEPTDAKIRAWYAELLLRQQQWEQAAEQLQALIRLQPANAVALGQYGAVLLRLGRTEESIHPLQQALMHEPDFVPAQQNLRLAQMLRRVSALEADLSQWPDRAASHVELAQLQLELGQLNKALEHLHAAVHLEPQQISHRIMLAQTLFRTGDDAKALRELEQAAAIDPSHDEPIVLQAWILATSSNSDVRDPKRALSLARQACDMTQYQQVSALIVLADALIANDQTSQAVETLNKAVERATELGQQPLVQMLQERLRQLQQR